MTQSAFLFERTKDYSPESFLVSDSNRHAYELVTNLPWKNYALNLYGEKSSGKTHLCNVFANVAGSKAVILEDVITGVDEVALLHELNFAKENGKFALITSAEPISKIAFTLPDLKSRINIIDQVSIEAPDSGLFYMLFARKFHERQLKVSDDIISYLSTRIERSFANAEKIVEAIDKLSLEQRRNITIPLVKEIL